MFSTILLVAFTASYDVPASHRDDGFFNRGGGCQGGQGLAGRFRDRRNGGCQGIGGCQGGSGCAGSGYGCRGSGYAPMPVAPPAVSSAPAPAVSAAPIPWTVKAPIPSYQNVDESVGREHEGILKRLRNRRNR